MIAVIDGLPDSPVPAAGPTLQAAGLTKSFGTTEVLRGCDMRVNAGEIVAVMGPSGSGKSTLLHCLAGILVPDGGAVEYAGKRVDTLPDTERTRLRRTEFGFVFQFGQLVPELTAEENVMLPLLFAGSSRRVAQPRAIEWLGAMGLDGLAARRPGELSGGQAQRVAVARAMVIEPKVIFADEPTGSLDSVTGRGVLETFTKVARANGTSVILITHAPDVTGFADRVLTVQDGLVAYDASERRGAP